MKCTYCGYEGKDGMFADNTCPACCRDIITGKKEAGAIPTVFFEQALTGIDLSSIPDETVAVWQTKDGRIIPITEMATSHLQNTINMLRRKGFISKSDFQFYLNCPMPNGEMAYEAVEREIDAALDSEVHPALDSLEEELKRREVITSSLRRKV